MGQFSPVKRPSDHRLPLRVAVGPHHQDHRFGGRAVLPAVDTIQVLAGAVRTHAPDIPVSDMQNARFDRFLTVPVDARHLDAFVELHRDGDGAVTAALITRSTAGRSGITRNNRHGQASFAAAPPPPVPPADRLAALDGHCLSVPAKRVYDDLVPFGAAYRNISGKLMLSASGALAALNAPVLPPDEAPLGSPYPLDAAFHMACVWGQRFAGMVAFPVAFERRVLYAPTTAGGRYLGRVFPVSRTPASLIFDIWIFDEDGAPREAALGVDMRDVSGGQWLPPAWIAEGAGDRRLPHLYGRTTGCRLVELDAVTPAARRALAPLEAARFEKMGARRRRSFLAARVACKGLARTISPQWGDAAAETILTVLPDDPKPVCPPAAHCSVAHDARFAVAVAGEAPVGVDVEPVSPRVLKSQRIYMSDAEQAMVAAAPMGATAAAVRVWTAKEAAAKALGMTLAEALSRVQITGVGDSESRLEVDGGAAWTVWHDRLDDHLFTLFDGTAAEG